MVKLIVESKYWEIKVRVGNDHGEEDYVETRTYETEEEFHNALKWMNYYDIPLAIREVVEYKKDYEEEIDEDY